MTTDFYIRILKFEKDPAVTSHKPNQSYTEPIVAVLITNCKAAAALRCGSRERAYKAKNSQSEAHLRKYKNKRNDVSNLICEAKAQYLQKLQTSSADPKTKPKQYYKIANEITNLKNENDPPPRLVKNGNIDIHPLVKAETLNKHFAIYINNWTPQPLPELEENPHVNLSSIQLSEQDVKDQLFILNSNKPGGPDEIMPKVIKSTGSSLVKPLIMLFNKSLSLGQVPK